MCRSTCGRQSGDRPGSLAPGCRKAGVRHYPGGRTHRPRSGAFRKGGRSTLAAGGGDQARRCRHTKAPASGHHRALLYNQKYLYVTYACEDDTVRATLTQHHDPLYTEDVVETFLAPSGSFRSFYEIEVSPLNTIYESYQLSSSLPDGSYRWLYFNPGYTCRGLVSKVFVDGVPNKPHGAQGLDHGNGHSLRLHRRARQHRAESRRPVASQFLPHRVSSAGCPCLLGHGHRWVGMTSTAPTASDGSNSNEFITSAARR